MIEKLTADFVTKYEPAITAIAKVNATVYYGFGDSIAWRAGCRSVFGTLPEGHTLVCLLQDVREQKLPETLRHEHSCLITTFAHHMSWVEFWKATEAGEQRDQLYIEKDGSVIVGHDDMWGRIPIENKLALLRREIEAQAQKILAKDMKVDVSLHATAAAGCEFLEKKWGKNRATTLEPLVRAFVGKISETREAAVQKKLKVAGEFESQTRAAATYFSTLRNNALVPG